LCAGIRPSEEKDGYPRAEREPARDRRRRTTTGEERLFMTVPEENRPKTETTDDLLDRRQESTERAPGGTGRTLREALEEAQLRPDDFKEE
jgi:hypothetical protein